MRPGFRGLWKTIQQFLLSDFRQLGVYQACHRGLRLPELGFRVWGLGFEVEGFKGLGLRV